MKRKHLLLIAMLLPIFLHAKHYQISNSKTGFDAPDGFKPMSPEMIRIKYPKGNAPDFVLTNDSTETTIAYGIRAKKLPQEEMEITAKAFEKGYSRVVAGFELKSNKIVTISGQKWIQMEFVSNTIDSKVYNIFLVTGYKDQMLVINLNSTFKEFPKYEKELRKFIGSIVLKG